VLTGQGCASRRGIVAARPDPVVLPNTEASAAIS